MPSQVFCGKLLPVKVGQVINIRGKTSPKAERFVIYLGIDETFGKDYIHGLASIPLHVAFEFVGDSKVVRTCYVEGIGWDENEDVKENLLTKTTNPIKPGDEFQVSIIVEENQFVIHIDDLPFCKFPFRQDLSTIKILSVCGDVEELYEIEHLPAKKKVKHGHGTFTTAVPEFKNDYATLIKGKLSGAEGQLDINLVNAENGKVLLKMNANLTGKKFVAISGDESLSSHRASTIEDLRNFPFVIGKTFKLAVGIARREFVISINGSHRTNCGFTDNSFIGSPVKFQVVSRDGVSCNVVGVDTVLLEKPTPLVTKTSQGNAENIPRQSETNTEVNAERKLKAADPDPTAKWLAQILHH